MHCGFHVSDEDTGDGRLLEGLYQVKPLGSTIGQVALSTSQVSKPKCADLESEDNNNTTQVGLIRESSKRGHIISSSYHSAEQLQGTR